MASAQLNHRLCTLDIDYARQAVETFDLVVIGSGPGGEKAAAQAAYFGKRVAVIERAPEPGGAAVHTGTLPSKTLRETAVYLSGHQARALYGVGVSLDESATLQTLMARKRAIAARESRRILQNLSAHGVEYIRGHGRFLESTVVEVTNGDADSGVESRRVKGEVVLIATGSVPRRPVDVEFASPRIHDSDLVLEIDAIPKTLVVLGAGVIGVEYACMFAALGCEVTLVEARLELLTFLDAEIRDRLEQAMEGLGIRIMRARRWGEVSDAGTQAMTTLDNGEVLRADQMLFAAGRVGRTAGLGLENIGLLANHRGYLDVDESFRTQAPGVLAVGDVVGFPALASVSMEQGRVAVCRAFGFEYKRTISPVLPYGIYTIPEVSTVGETERQARARGARVAVGRAFFKENARGQIQGDLSGMTKLVACADTKTILGVHVIGERASELVHLGQAALVMGATLDLFIEMVFNFPTLSETYKYAAYDCMKNMACA